MKKQKKLKIKYPPKTPLTFEYLHNKLFIIEELSDNDNRTVDLYVDKFPSVKIEEETK